ncbi:MAG TPA: hypothetical protein VE913_24655 [Longimicrobium sp.]|nr:hypothetical protein [Longimicrobium sp.]
MIRPVRLPDEFYLPRSTWSGLTIHDVVPWEDATDYVTDGRRYGVRFENGRVDWMEGSEWRWRDELRDDFGDADLDALVDGLQRYLQGRRHLAALWSEDVKTLEQLRDERRDGRD